ncbi:hypothetical protein GCM10028805_52230 [Spirosoma harenae]
MLQLKLYPSEFRVLIHYVRMATQYQAEVPLQHQLVSKLILINYLVKWTPARYLAWRQRRADKAFSLRLPLVVALSLYQDMLSVLLNSHQQALLDKLDQAIVNYRSPTDQALLTEFFPSTV